MDGRGDKVVTMRGEGGVLVAGFDSDDWTMVEITWSNDADRLGRCEGYPRRDLRAAASDEAARIPTEAPFIFPGGWVALPK